MGEHLMAAARAFDGAGLCVIPVKADGSKKPGIRTWKPFQSRRPSEAELNGWFGNGTERGIGIVWGAVSGNGEALDFDEVGLYEKFDALCREHGQAELLDSLPLVETPSGGRHLYWRGTAPVPGNQKIAQRQGEGSDIETLIETRGEGGYTIAPGSPPDCHPDRKQYRFLRGHQATIPTITPEQRSIFIALATTFNEYVKPEAVRTAPGSRRAKGDGLRPGEDYNARGDYEALLERHGWRRLRGGDKGLWQRPGKTGPGISATSNYAGSGLFYVFSSNAAPFEPQETYSPFAVYTLIEHGGDYTVAARALGKDCYGDRRESARSSGRRTDDPREVPAEDPARFEPGMADGLPAIETNRRHLRDQTADALNALVALNEPPEVFVRGGHLSCVRVDETGRATVADMDAKMLRGRLARCANFVSTSEKRGAVAVAPPKDVVDDLSALPSWRGLPPLVGIVTAPLVAPDGTVQTRPGYHRTTRVFYHEARALDIPYTQPTQENVSRAKSLLVDDLLGDFPFADQASLAHAVALLLLPFARLLIDGPTPLHLIDAPTAGTGKGLLAEVCTGVFVPQGAAAKSPPTEEAEWCKTLTSVFKEGDSHLLIDNARRLDSPSLLAAVTAPVWKDRLLGSNSTVEFENRLTWVVTCNNISCNDELTRRSIWIRLDAGLENPSERGGFRHANLSHWARENRGALIGAALTLVRAWVDAGRPAAKQAKPLGRFESWTDALGGILENAGIGGFLGNRESLRDRADTETAAWQGFVAAWNETHGAVAVTATELFPLALEWLPERLGDGTERSQKSKLGRLLVRHSDRVYAGQKITTAGKGGSGAAKNVAQYRLEDAKSVDMGDMGDLSLSPMMEYQETHKDGGDGAGYNHGRVGDKSPMSPMSTTVGGEVDPFSGEF